MYSRRIIITVIWFLSVNVFVYIDCNWENVRKGKCICFVTHRCRTQIAVSYSFETWLGSMCAWTDIFG